MNFQKFYDASGKLESIVNLDAVTTAEPSEDGRLLLHAGDETVSVDSEQFEKAVAADRDHPAELIAQSANRLVQALDRLGVRIPTSIRMHM